MSQKEREYAVSSHTKAQFVLADCFQAEEPSALTPIMQKISDLHQPCIFTRQGQRKAILLDFDRFELLLEELELLRDVRLAEEQLGRGQYLTDDEARKRLLA